MDVTGVTGELAGATSPDDLLLPYRGASPRQALRRFRRRALRFRRRALRFGGRSSRSEYWWIIGIVVAVEGLLALIAWPLQAAAVRWIVANQKVADVWLAAMEDALDRGEDPFSPDWQGPPSPAQPEENPWLLLLQIVAIVLVIVLLVPLLSLTWRRLHDAGLPGALALIGLVLPIVPLVLCTLPPRPEGRRFDTG